MCWRNWALGVSLGSSAPLGAAPSFLNLGGLQTTATVGHILGQCSEGASSSSVGVTGQDVSASFHATALHSAHHSYSLPEFSLSLVPLGTLQVCCHHSSLWNMWAVSHPALGKSDFCYRHLPPLQKIRDEPLMGTNHFNGCQPCGGRRKPRGLEAVTLSDQLSLSCARACLSVKSAAPKCMRPVGH